MSKLFGSLWNFLFVTIFSAIIIVFIHLIIEGSDATYMRYVEGPYAFENRVYMACGVILGWFISRLYAVWRSGHLG